MSEQNKARPEDARAQPAASFCDEMMKQMRGHQVQGTAWAQLVSQCCDLKAESVDFLEAMSQLMTACCEPQGEPGTESQYV